MAFISASEKGSVGLSGTFGRFKSSAKFSATHLRFNANRNIDRSRSNFLEAESGASFQEERNSDRSSSLRWEIAAIPLAEAYASNCAKSTLNFRMVAGVRLRDWQSAMNFSRQTATVTTLRGSNSPNS